MATGYILQDSPNPYTAQGTYPRRGGHKLSGTCIVHTSEGAWTSGVDGLTRLVKTRSDYGCYHQACDWEDIARYYHWEWETWQDTETNNWAVGIAAACRTSDWTAMPPNIAEGYYRNMAKMAADFVLYMRTKGIEVPRRRITGAQARAGVPGFCAHGDSGIARSDPGANFDWGKFLRYIDEELDGDDVTLTPEQDQILRYLASPQFKAHMFTGQHPLEIEARAAFIRDIFSATLPWYGYNGNIPAEGRKETNLGIQLGWLDTQVAATHGLVAAQTNAILDALKNLPQIPDEFIEDLRTQLSEELKKATDGLSVVLKVEPQVEPPSE